MLLALAELVVGWLLVEHAAMALRRRIENPADAAVYDGKVVSARFFCETVLPGLTLTRKLVEASSLSAIEVPDEAF